MGLFYGPNYQVQDAQYYGYTDHPGWSHDEADTGPGQETGMVLVVPMYEEDETTSGVYTTRPR
jgi:hypothetical protein